STPDGQFLEFMIAPDGSAVTVSHRSPFDWPDFLTAILGPALAAILHLRNIPILHASAVVIDGRATLIAGHAEAGKSTLIAGLIKGGASLLCDDLAPLSITGEGANVLPGHPLLKLSPQTFYRLGIPPQMLQPVFPISGRTEEQWFDTRFLNGGFQRAQAPLQGVYLIAGRRSDIEAPLILPYAPARACLDLSKHLYGKGWLSREPEETLKLSAQIARTIPVCRVWLPDSLDTLEVNASTIREDALFRSGRGRNQREVMHNA
ncbi:MAG: hypothetical protein PHY31_09205, partial [Smithellaceae bacterium]|nr:hypothetical protein [Smithellaceae bacterium]